MKQHCQIHNIKLPVGYCPLCKLEAILSPTKTTNYLLIKEDVTAIVKYLNDSLETMEQEKSDLQENLKGMNDKYSLNYKQSRAAFEREALEHINEKAFQIIETYFKVHLITQRAFVFHVKQYSKSYLRQLPPHERWWSSSLMFCFKKFLVHTLINFHQIEEGSKSSLKLYKSHLEDIKNFTKKELNSRIGEITRRIYKQILADNKERKRQIDANLDLLRFSGISLIGLGVLLLATIVYMQFTGKYSPDYPWLPFGMSIPGIICFTIGLRVLWNVTQQTAHWKNTEGLSFAEDISELKSKIVAAFDGTTEVGKKANEALAQLTDLMSKSKSQKT